MSRLALCREQEEAVKHSVEAPLIVLAGPGSGKTTVIVSRIQFMVEEKQINPKNILVLTFSNSAAKELRARVVLGGGNRLCVHTFHSFCWALLLDCNLVTPFTSVYDEFSSLRLIKECVIHHRSTNATEQQQQQQQQQQQLSAGAQQKPRAILDAINKFKVNSQTTVSLRKANNLTLEQKEVLAVWELLETRKEHNSAVDFNDMLLLAINVLRQSVATRTRYQQLYQYVLVDEFQDTNSLQFDLLRLLVPASPGRVTIVGDDDQSIYRWRGATLANWTRFKEVFSQHVSVHLKVNFRSTQNIISACTGLISFNQSRLKKTFGPVICGSHKSISIAVCLTSCQSSSIEAMHVAERVRRLVNDGLCNFRDIAVLFRSNPQGANVKRLALSFKSMGIPYVTSQDAITCEGERDVVAALTLLVNPVDGVALSLLLQRVCGLKGNWSAQISLEQIITNEIPSGLTRHSGALLAFANFFRVWAEMCDSQIAIKVLVDRIIEDIAEGCDMSAFLSRAQLEGEGHIRTQIGELLHSVCLAPLCPEPRNAVTLSTIHRAKGLEWDTVFAIQLAENVNWGSKKTPSKHETDEERRVMYVCLSRAKKRLFLSYPNIANGERTTPSRYVHEIKKRGGNIQRLKYSKGVISLAKTLGIQTKQAAERAAAVIAMKKLVAKTPRTPAPGEAEIRPKKAPARATLQPKPSHCAPRSHVLSLFDTVRNSWQCLVCTFKNSLSSNRAFCEICNAPKLNNHQDFDIKTPSSCSSSSSSTSSTSSSSQLASSSSASSIKICVTPSSSSLHSSSFSPLVFSAAASLRAVFDEADEEIKHNNTQEERIPPLEALPSQQLAPAQQKSDMSPTTSSLTSADPSVPFFSFASLPALSPLSSQPLADSSTHAFGTVQSVFNASFLPKGTAKSRSVNHYLIDNKRKAIKIEDDEVEEIASTTKRKKHENRNTISLLSQSSLKQDNDKENQTPNISATIPSSTFTSPNTAEQHQCNVSSSSPRFASAFPFSTSSPLFNSLSSLSATPRTIGVSSIPTCTEHSPVSLSPLASSSLKEVLIYDAPVACASVAAKLQTVTSTSVTATVSPVPSTSVFFSPRGGWLCSACTLENSFQATACELCECQRPSNLSITPLGNSSARIEPSKSLHGGAVFPKRSKFVSCLSQTTSRISDSANILPEFFDVKRSVPCRGSLLSSIIPGLPASRQRSVDFADEDDALAHKYFRRLSAHET